MNKNGVYNFLTYLGETDINCERPLDKLEDHSNLEYDKSMADVIRHAFIKRL